MADEPDIAFKYPNDGCYARAHLMIQRMEQRGISYDMLGKVWNEGDLWVRTRYDEYNTGVVQWTYHVAPYIQVYQNNGAIESMVIDPSLFGKPVPVEAWKDIQHDPNSILSLRKPDEPLYPNGSSYWRGMNDPAQGKDANARAKMDEYLPIAAFNIFREMWKDNSHLLFIP